MSNGVAGVCETIGFCSFPDASCDSGRKFEPGAPGGLGGECVELCGQQGQPCCDGEVSCTGNAFCQSAMCETCVLDVALGRRFICAVTYDGSVWCSGANDVGQLGNGASSATPRAEPVQVRDEAGKVLTGVIDVGAGYDFACAVKTDGTVWCWGANGVGQLGNGATLVPPATTPPPPLPWAVQVLTTDDEPLTGVAEVVAGDSSACARLHTGGVQCWGDNRSGRLGDGETTARSQADAVDSLSGVAAIDLAADHACARTTANNVLCWGDGGSGKLFTGDTDDQLSPVMIANASSVATGRHYTCIVGPDTTISCAGWSGHGRLGHGTGEGREGGGDELVPVQTLTEVGGAPFSGVAQVAAGGVTCARMLDSSLYCWGDNTYGTTGTGTGSTVPERVKLADGTPLTNVERVVVHYQHACAITSAGELLCWGRNLNGELGNGTFLNQGFPAPYKLGCP
ncbi:MAG TPA: hypothetical protein VIV11_05360 [Kofleriaceae bacterium]